MGPEFKISYDRPEEQGSSLDPWLISLLPRALHNGHFASVHVLLF